MSRAAKTTRNHPRGVFRGTTHQYPVQPHLCQNENLGPRVQVLDRRSVEAYYQWLSWNGHAEAKVPASPSANPNRIAIQKSSQSGRSNISRDTMELQCSRHTLDAWMTTTIRKTNTVPTAPEPESRNVHVARPRSSTWSGNEKVCWSPLRSCRSMMTVASHRSRSKQPDTTSVL